MTNEIYECIRKKVMKEIEHVVDNYDFTWAVDDTLNTSDYTSDIDDAILSYLADNISRMVGDIATEIIDEEIPEYIETAFAD